MQKRAHKFKRCANLCNIDTILHKNNTNVIFWVFGISKMILYVYIEIETYFKK